MFDTTTALQNIGSTNIVTPNIRVKMRANTHYTTQTPFSRTARAFDAIIFKDQYIIFGISSTVFGLGYLETTDLTGNTIWAINSLNSAFNSVGRFKTTGETLGFFYTTSSGNTSVIRSLFSGDGITWGNSTLIYMGSSSKILDLAPVGATRLYSLRSLGTTIQTLATIDVHKNVGGWGSTSIDSNAFYVHFGNEWDQDHKIVGDQISADQDRIIIQYADAPGNKVGLKTITTDHTKAFGDMNIVTSEPSTELRYITTTNLVKHSDTYYLGLQTFENNYVTDGGITQVFGYNSPLMYIKSQDLNNWSIPYIISGVTREYAGLPGLGHIGSLASGITSELNFTWFGVSHNLSVSQIVSQGERNVNVYTGKSQLDLSSDLIAYQNLNNERINMTIGNFRTVISEAQGGVSIPSGASSGFQYLLLALGWLP
jgi:hypothetical protein